MGQLIKSKLGLYNNRKYMFEIVQQCVVYSYKTISYLSEVSFFAKA